VSEARSVVSWSAQDTDVDAIERALALLARRRALAVQDEVAAASGNGSAAPGDHPPARSRVQNLICPVPDEDTARSATRAIGRLAGTHPSRALILIADAGGADGIDARLAVHAHASRDFHLNDVVVLTCRGAAAAHLAGVADPLLLPDLPTILWCPGDCALGPPAAGGRRGEPRSRRRPAFHGSGGGTVPDPASALDRLVELADRLVVDSACFGAPLQDRLRALGALAASGGPPAVSDLNWRRLLAWRQGLARIFDRPEARAWLDALDAVQVHVPEGGAAGGLLLAGWLSARLGRRLRRVTGEEPGIEVRAGSAARFALRPQGGCAELSWTVEGVRTVERVRLPNLGEADLLAAELAAGVDPSLREALTATGGSRPAGR
jgi:glucose-6-phosphate dehydrogenase assembly protein OpcA